MLEHALQRIVDQTIATRLPEPWDFLNPDPSIRLLGSEPSSLVAALLGEFPPDDLVNAEILLRDSGGAHRLTPIIEANVPFKILRRKNDGPPCDLEHERGRLTSGDPAAFRCLDDHVTRERCTNQKWVLATFSNADLAVLTLLGLPATPAWGLSRVTADQARGGFSSPKTITAVSTPVEGKPRSPDVRPKIILVATELFALRNQVPRESLQTAMQFRRIEDAMKLDTASAVGIWRPTTARFRRICDCVALADPQLVRSAIVKSVQGCESIKKFFESSSAPVGDNLLTARKKTRDAMRRLEKSLFGIRELPAQLEALRRAHETALVEKAHQQASTAANVLIGGLWSCAAELLQMQFDSSDLTQRTTAAIATGRVNDLDTLILDRLNFQLRLADGLFRIKKSIETVK
jgi:hypothetical protein